MVNPWRLKGEGGCETFQSFGPTLGTMTRQDTLIV